MKTYITGTILMLIFSGCGHYGTEMMETNNKKFGFETSSKRETGQDQKQKAVLDTYIEQHHELKEVLAMQCKLPRYEENKQDEKLSPAVISIVSSSAKMIFDMYMTKKSKELENLKKASQHTYSASYIYSGNEFNEAYKSNQKQCVILYRYNKDNPDSVGMLSVLKLKNYNNTAFTFSPVYVKLNDTVALIQKDKPAANITFAVAIKAVVTNKDNNIKELKTIATGSVSAGKLMANADSNASCLDGCNNSDLVVYPPNGTNPVSLTFAVTESGDIGIDFEEQIAKLNTIKAAMGPAIKDAVAKHYAD